VRDLRAQMMEKYREKKVKRQNKSSSSPMLQSIYNLSLVFPHKTVVCITHLFPSSELKLLEGRYTQFPVQSLALGRLNAAAAAVSLQLCLTLCDPIDGKPPGSPWDSPGKNTGVGCHFLLQCMKAKSESEVTQSCLTLSDPMDWSPPGSSVHGIFQARELEWGAIAFSIAVNKWINST